MLKQRALCQAWLCPAEWSWHSHRSNGFAKWVPKGLHDFRGNKFGEPGLGFEWEGEGRGGMFISVAGNYERLRWNTCLDETHALCEHRGCLLMCWCDPPFPFEVNTPFEGGWFLGDTVDAADPVCIGEHRGHWDLLWGVMPAFLEQLLRSGEIIPPFKALFLL